MTDAFKDFVSKAAALDQAAAIDQQLGYPRKGTNVGRPPHVVIPASYTPGALGWTATACDVTEDVSGTALLTTTQEAVVTVGKRTVTVPGKGAIAVDLTAGVANAKPAKYLEKP
jgi:hypothetical protein